ncbi:MAG: hypothetical protein LBR16_08665 [Treponema sp.]|nr:hypothetical protein [Treponema sp.]
MKSIADYNEQIPDDEVFSFLCGKVTKGEVRSFSQLRQCAEPVFKSQKRQAVLVRVFELIKRLNWGYFWCLDPLKHRKLWAELVVPDKQFSDVGDIKQIINMETSIHICMLDIHGYTKFCQESRKNPSMLSTLDEAINNDIRAIADKCGAVCNRERGDEIVVVTASATDALAVTLGIFDYFAKTNILRDSTISVPRSGNAAILPAFKLSAGIAGGDIKTPLAITGQGSLTGFLLNMGARLQSRANELSPVESKIMITKQAVMRFKKENAADQSRIFRGAPLYFMDTGAIEFKGVQILTCEAIFKAEDRYKEHFSVQLQRLFDSTRENLWEQRIFFDLMELVGKAASEMPRFNVPLPAPLNGLVSIDNESLTRMASDALKAYSSDEDYPAAVAILHDLALAAGAVPSFDRIILDYLKVITEKYEHILEAYRSEIDREIDNRAAKIFSKDYYKAWQTAKQTIVLYDKLKALGRGSKELPPKRVLWFGLIKKNQEKMRFKFHSGK